MPPINQTQSVVAYNWDTSQPSTPEPDIYDHHVENDTRYILVDEPLGLHMPLNYSIFAESDFDSEQTIRGQDHQHHMLSADCMEFKVNIKELAGVSGTEQLIVSIQNASALQDNYTVLLVASCAYFNRSL